MSQQGIEQNAYAEFVKERIEAGDDPNTITDGIEKALDQVNDWGRWGDGHYRLDTVCSICGETFAGVCGHERDPQQQVILRRKYKAAQQ